MDKKIKKFYGVVITPFIATLTGLGMFSFYSLLNMNSILCLLVGLYTAALVGNVTK